LDTDFISNYNKPGNQDLSNINNKPQYRAA